MSRGLFYLGDSFPVESFPGAILPGSIFRAAIFWEATFLEPCCFEIQTHMRQLKKLCCLLQKSRKITILHTTREYKQNVIQKHFFDILKLFRSQSREIRLKQQLMIEYCLQLFAVLCCLT